MSSFTARIAEQKDVAVIVRIQRVAVEKAWRHAILDFDTFFAEKFDTAQQTQKYTERLDDSARCFVIVEANNRIIGFASARIHETHEQPPGYDYQANAFYVDPDFQGTGAGAFLLSSTFNALAARGAKSMCCWCIEDNPRARRFYEREGGTLITNAVTPADYAATAPHVAYGWQF